MDNSTNDNSTNDNIKDTTYTNQLDTLLLNLKIISNIKEFDKLSTSNINNNIYIDSPHLLQSIVRKWNGDSRENTINIINNIVDSIFKISDKLLEEEVNVEMEQNSHINFNDNNSIIFQKIVISLTETISGIQNLKITYIGDISVISKLDIIISKIQNRISKINKMLKIDINII